MKKVIPKNSIISVAANTTNNAVIRHLYFSAAPIVFSVDTSKQAYQLYLKIPDGINTLIPNGDKSDGVFVDSLDGYSLSLTYMPKSSN